MTGKILHGDNIELLQTLSDNSVDSCISDFPYAIEFMGKNWDSSKHWNTGEGIHGQFPGTGYSGKRRPSFYANTHSDGLSFYNWCYDRAGILISKIKSGGYVAIFGHPKTNHRMKCAFEDAGFKVVEEIDWIFLSGMPKSQDIGKLFDKQDDPELAEIWNGWKTSGLKPAHEPITVFQKPLDGTYTDNIRQHGCGAMNIDACRVPISKEDIDMINAKASKNPTNNYSQKEGHIYGGFAEDKAMPANEAGRFPPNVLISDDMCEAIDAETGYSTSTGGSGEASRINRTKNVYSGFNPDTNKDYINDSLGGYGDSGGGSRMFPVFKYCPKPANDEKILKDGTANPHVTIKPVKLIMWLIKLLTPKNGMTIDITAGSCTHAVACEKLNREEDYQLSYIDMELMNSESEPYVNIGKRRVAEYIRSQSRKLF